jgi:hypothetical protein
MTNLFRALLKVLASLALVVVVWYIIYEVFTPDKEKLANEYKVDQDKVFVEAKPHGCDFDDAPLGNKHCRFEKVVDVERACPEPDCRVTGVYVSWRKVEE